MHSSRKFSVPENFEFFFFCVPLIGFMGSPLDLSLFVGHLSLEIFFVDSPAKIFGFRKLDFGPSNGL